MILLQLSNFLQIFAFSEHSTKKYSPSSTITHSSSALSLHTDLHLTHNQCASSSQFLYFLQNAVSLTLAQRRHLANACWMNEWVRIPLSTISSRDIWLSEKLRFLLGVLYNEVNCLLRCGHYIRYDVRWLPRRNRRCDVMRQYWQLQGWKLSFQSTWCLQI